MATRRLAALALVLVATVLIAAPAVARRPSVAP